MYGRKVNGEALRLPLSFGVGSEWGDGAEAAWRRPPLPFVIIHFGLTEEGKHLRSPLLSDSLHRKDQRGRVRKMTTS